jgi:hypothetical protein
MTGKSELVSRLEAELVVIDGTADELLDVSTDDVDHIDEVVIDGTSEELLEISTNDADQIDEVLKLLDSLLDVEEELLG